MSIEVVIYDYVDSSGRNLIEEWMDSIGLKSKAKINGLLHNLEDEPANQWHRFKFIENLRGRGATDLWEIKAKPENLQLRPIGCFGPGASSFTLLFGAVERGGRFEPRYALDYAQQRKEEVRNDPENRRTRHFKQ